LKFGFLHFSERRCIRAKQQQCDGEALEFHFPVRKNIATGGSVTRTTLPRPSLKALLGNPRVPAEAGNLTVAKPRAPAHAGFEPARGVASPGRAFWPVTYLARWPDRRTSRTDHHLEGFDDRDHHGSTG